MRLLEGYVKNRTKEIALAGIFAALYVIMRQVKIDITPLVSIRISGAFVYIPATFLSWQFTWLIPLIMTFTSVEPVGSVTGILTGIQIAYFGSRLLPKYRVVFLLLATYAANFMVCTTRSIMGLFQFQIMILPYMFKATTLACVLLILAPPMWKILQIYGITDAGSES